jgi:glyoxylase-like metal-dependent hydrolase (beta-lactamase superfamily II)
MTVPPAFRGDAAQHRFGRVGRIPTPTPLPVGDINSYALLPEPGSDELTLIDTGLKSPESFEALRLGLKAHGFALEQIRRILVTHAHMDHYGQARRLRELSGAPVFTSALEAERMKGFWSPSAQRDERVLAWFRRWGVPPEAMHADGGIADFARRLSEPLEVDGILADGDRVSFGDVTLEVIATPGHCEGHIVFYDRERRLLFSGDHLLTDISPVPLLSFPKREGEPRPKSLVRFLQSLARVERLEVDLTFPSHGDVIHDHRKLIAGYRLHHEKRALQMRRALESGPRTPFELATRLFPRHWSSQIFLVMSEVIGHLDVLAEQGSVRIEERNGVEQVRLAA